MDGMHRGMKLFARSPLLVLLVEASLVSEASGIALSPRAMMFLALEQEAQDKSHVDGVGLQLMACLASLDGGSAVPIYR